MHLSLNVLVVEYHVCCSRPCWTPCWETNPPFLNTLLETDSPLFDTCRLRSRSILFPTRILVLRAVQLCLKNINISTRADVQLCLKRFQKSFFQQPSTKYCLRSTKQCHDKCLRPLVHLNQPLEECANKHISNIFIEEIQNFSIVITIE